MTRFRILMVVMLAACAISVPAMAGVDGGALSQPSEPGTAGEAATAVGDAITAAQGGQWWYFSALAVLIVMFILKVSTLLDRMGRWKYIVSPTLSLAAALLAAFQGGVSFEVAAGVFTSAWATGMLEELVNHGILGKPRST